MKNLIFISVLLLLGLGSKAQNTEFTENSYNIFLKSGKLIKNVKLWKIDTFKVEYVSNGNLADVNTYEVLDIETQEYYFIFDSSNDYIKNFWDTIIDYNNEFLKGRIVIIDSFYITFFPYNKNKTIKINYKSYKINNSNPASVIIINSKRKVISNSDITSDTLKNENTYLENVSISPNNKKFIDKNSNNYKKFNKGCGILTVSYLIMLMIIYISLIFI